MLRQLCKASRPSQQFRSQYLTIETFGTSRRFSLSRRRRSTTTSSTETDAAQQTQSGPSGTLDHQNAGADGGAVTLEGPPIVRHVTLKRHELESRPNGSVVIEGLVRSVRKHKTSAFARISDGTTLDTIQAYFPRGDQAKELTNGSYAALKGKYVASPAAGQASELQVEEVLELGLSDPLQNPIQKKAMTPEYLRSVPHLRMRTDHQALILRARALLSAAVHTHFRTSVEPHSPVYEVHPPLITSSDCEGAGEVFTLTPKSSLPPPLPSNGTETQDRLYFREPKYLTVSSQLHLEAFSAELGNVYALSPAFRAEESDTPRHLAEFYMLEAEYRFINFDELMNTLTLLVKDIVRRVCESPTYEDLLRHRARSTSEDPGQVDLKERWRALRGEWLTLDYTTAIEELRKANDAAKGRLFAREPTWKNGLQLEHERWIADVFAEHRPVFVTNFPKVVKPFYMLPSNATGADTVKHLSSASSTHDGETVACFDLLLPYGYGEVAGGSLREHRLRELVQSMREKGLLKKTGPEATNTYPFLEPDESLGSLKWYADLRRFGSSPHGGYGLGFDRLLAYLTGATNVRDVVAFPRVWGRADC